MKEFCIMLDAEKANDYTIKGIKELTKKGFLVEPGVAICEDSQEEELYRMLEPYKDSLIIVPKI